MPNAKIEKPTDVLVRITTNICGSDLHMYEGRTDTEAGRVFVVDTHKDRLKLAQKIGAVAIDDTEGNGVEQIKELTKGQGADCGCECVGYQCCNMHGKEVPNLTMNNLVQAVKPTGGIGVVGVFLPQDPGAQDELAKEGKLAFDFGQLAFLDQAPEAYEKFDKRARGWTKVILKPGK